MKLKLSGEDLKLLEKVTGAKVDKIEAENRAFFDNLFEDIGKLLLKNTKKRKTLN